MSSGGAALRLDYRLVESWPPLAWAARVSRRSSAVEVLHGFHVEVHREWFCEAIWDEAYVFGAFDETDLVFGSGGRLRDGGLTFVSAGTTVDRLHSLQADDEVWISNSLVCLLAVTRGRLDLAHTGYGRALQSIRRGLDHYQRTLSSSAGPVELTYFHNLRWTGQELRCNEKPFRRRDFSSFESYRGFLTSALGRLAANMNASERSVPYTMLGTLSSGYDSAAAAALAREAGLRRAVTFTTARGGKPDDGSEIGRGLGLEVLPFSRSLWEEIPLAQVPFLAADAGGGDVFFKAAESELAEKVLLTGYHGGGVWGLGGKGSSGTGIERKDKSGLSLAEYRLWVGFIHCPVPFMGARQVAEIREISLSPELEAWRLHTNYDRPVPRRVLEEAGIAREAFGCTKRAAFVLSGRGGFRSAESMQAYVNWLDALGGRWWGMARLPPRLHRGLLRPVQVVLHFGLRILRRVKGSLPVRLRGLWHFSRAELLDRHLFHWAIERARERYRF